MQPSKITKTLKSGYIVQFQLFIKPDFYAHLENPDGKL